MTAILPDAAERIRAITELARPRLAVPNVPGPVTGGPTNGGPTGPGTYRCAECGEADRLLVDHGFGRLLCLNIDRCQP